ncbi:MAG: thioredoxin family protein [Longimicrobiales bacterium]
MKATSSIGLLALAILAPATAANAQTPEREPFTEERFAALQDQDALILLDVFADWCPTCARQQEILAAFQNENPQAPLHILSIDFDEQRDLVRRFRAPRQSTLILYRGDEQLWFSVAETRREVIFEALNQALGGTQR